MKNFQKQRGASFVFWVFILALLGFLLTVGIKLFPVYYDGISTNSIIEDLAVELEGKKPNKKQIWNLIRKRLDINSIYNVERDHFVYEAGKGTVEFGLDYEVRVPLIANVDAVVKFNQRKSISNK